MEEQNNVAQLIAGLGSRRRWCDRTRPEVCRLVTIDPVLQTVELEDPSGHIESDTIEHFLSTHFAEAS